MIFVTVGTDLPFDRMVRVVDQWARETDRKDVFAQIGEGGWKPEFIPSAEFLEPAEFKQRIKEATLIIAHAGMGTIISSLLHGKAVLVMPKKASLGEQRNEHQLATAKRMMEMGKVHVAADETELRTMLNEVDTLAPRSQIGSSASPELVAGLRNFIHSGSR